VRVALLFGGPSVEHEVSVVSARGVAGALARTEMVAVPLAVTGAGEWLSPERSAAILAGDARRVEAGSAGDPDDGVRVALVPGSGGLLRVASDGAAEPLGIDVLFPLVHGWGGEDGRLQGALDLAGVPYVGSGVMGSAVAMDKAVARQLFRSNGLAVAPGRVLTCDEVGASGTLAGAAWQQRLVAELGLPLFVKPANGGSSVGIHRVTSADGLAAAVGDAFRYDAKLVVEQGLDAREIECAVLGAAAGGAPEASGLGEILPEREFYDYEAKYVDDSTRLEIPARLDAETAEILRRQALTAFRALDLRGFARVDFLVDRGSGRIYVNEVNSLPGFTPISMFPKLWEAAGLEYPRLVERLVQLARDAAPAVPEAAGGGRRAIRRSVS
jgi:D-alanine-D-alanine ligase